MMRTLKTISVATCLALSMTAAAQVSSPRLKGALDYEINGGFMPTAPTKISPTTFKTVGAGVSWKTDLSCGNFDPRISVANQLGGVTDGFQDMMRNIIQNATAAVAGLPALIIARASPQLYELLQKGILSAEVKISDAELSCEAIQDVIMGNGTSSMPWEKLKVATKSDVWKSEIATSGGDIVRAKQDVQKTKIGNAGVTWFCGEKRGGSGQEPGYPIYDTVVAGYNMIHHQTDICDRGFAPGGAAAGSPIAQYWPRAYEAATYALNVVGETFVVTCDGCNKATTSTARGLLFYLKEERESLRNQLEALVLGTAEINPANLTQVSAPPGIYVNGPLIRKLQQYGVNGQGEMIDRLASEIAYARIVEKARLLIRLIRTGMKEPNVQAQGPEAMPWALEAIEEIEQELRLIDKEIVTRKMVAKETIARLLGAEEKRIQSTRAPDAVNTSPVGSMGLKKK